MKRFLSIILLAATVLSVCACAADRLPAVTAPETEPAGSSNACQHRLEISHTTPATCTEAGCIVRLCAQCGEEFAEDIPATGHTFSAASCTQAATCVDCGSTGSGALGHDYVSGTCSRCGHRMPGYEDAPAGCEHEYRLTAQIAPTCTSSGSLSYTCNLCNDVYTDPVAAKGHTYADATCDQAKTCRTCASTDGTALGHSYENGKCSRCGAADPSAPAEVTYTVTVRSDKGKLIEGVTVTVFTDAQTPAAVGKTNSKGVATMELMSAPSYRLVLSNVPAEYSAKESYTFHSTRVNINLTTLPQITAEDHSKANYKVGSVMGDFTLTDTDGNSYTLSELLREKDLVILNFWFVNCGPCKAEFPYFETVHKQYGNVQLLTLNHLDSVDNIKTLRQQMGVTFPMISENIGFRQGFDINAYPTTVFIDKSGKILKIKVGEFRTLEELETMINSYLN